jgi:hypothetical protein
LENQSVRKGKLDLSTNIEYMLEKVKGHFFMSFTHGFSHKNDGGNMEGGKALWI